ncbi:bifunctional 3,4-dihydroxy-2-butanone-4-phosphate synthase/GTP cyclohydrolase II [Fuerstiella marisgermanici]|uniref:GTP cyclohydrolase-2 n=1 Tax=Fuerstiella marisgermanici TaxID=1891926 RepID=A0A1P8WRW1_9PLAN|nr:bifunctional 3,4-dihydroxy-2-butanone-4-phosphate synthase/GTP cyclohydrolase II [Fuerstiella marisgermanici]APZ96778.1 Riboflavin biosynthesis protein RibBA [Fuerstiella marisgermanici]
MPFKKIDNAVQALKQGRMIIVVDDEDRENEGDFVCAAETVTPEQVDFMLKIGRGTMCVPMSVEEAERLRLKPVIDDSHNTAPHKTAFLTTVDHLNAGTGVSADNRACTIRELANPNATADDFVKPGHMSPLMAMDGGVLRRAGHTEATVDLMRMAGMRPVGTLIEICSQRGHGMADMAELEEISAEYDIPIISIEELIKYRRLREQLVSRAVEVQIPTKNFGTPTMIGYQVAHENQEPMAMVWGDLTKVDAPLVRMHSSCFTGDVVDSLRCDCGDQLHMAMQMIHSEAAGAVVYLPQEGRGIGLLAKLKAYKLQDEGLDTVEANHKLGFKADMRDYMVGLQILKDLGLTKVRLLTNNPKKTESFVYSGVDLEVVEQVPIVAPPHACRSTYMATKKEKMGHLLPEDS